MRGRGRKPVLAICARSGKEAYLHEMVDDGYMKGIKVLPEYYCPPQPVHYRPKPELPPFNPQPLADVWKAVIKFIGHTDVRTGSAVNPPFSYTSYGFWGFHSAQDIHETGVESVTAITKFIIPHHETMAGVECLTNAGSFILPAYISLAGVVCNTSVNPMKSGDGWSDGSWGQGTWSGAGPNSWGEGTWGEGSWSGSTTGWGKNGWGQNNWSGS